MPPRTITVDDLWALPRVGIPAPAPDGSYVVVPLTTYSMESNEATTRLWMVPAGNPEAPAELFEAARPLTSADFSASQPAIDPGGQRVAFVRKLEKASKESPDGHEHSEEPQLYLLSLEGGEPERLTDLPLGVHDPRWFPDGRRLAFLGRLLPEAPTVEGTAELAKERREDPVEAHVTEDRLYRHWDRWLVGGPIHHIFVLDLETREMIDVTPDLQGWFPFTEPADHFHIAPDATEIGFTAARSQPPHDPFQWGAYTVSIPDPDRIGEDDMAPESVLLDPNHAGHAIRPVYSPDGRWTVYGIQHELDFYADKVRLVAHERAGGRRTVLTESWDRSAADWQFDPHSGQLVILAEDRARRLAFTLDVEAAAAAPDDHPPALLHEMGGWLGDIRPAAGRVFSTWQSLTAPPEVFAISIDGATAWRVSAFCDERMADLELGGVESIEFIGADDESVQAYLIHPPSSATDGEGPPYPLVHLVHGGPHGAFGDQWHWRWNSQVVAASGHLVAMVNFHGSTGWGQAFTASILGRWGDQPYRDLMAATDHLVERGVADPTRMAVTGGSYGGYLVAWTVTQTDRFACAINHAGVSDFQAQFASDSTQGRRRSLGGEVWDDIEGLDRYNPMRHARAFRTPMLVIHGEQDYRVPHTQGIEIYNVYKAMGRPARLVFFPDENHWILKPRNSQLWYGEFLGWLERWLREDGGSANDESPQE